MGHFWPQKWPKNDPKMTLFWPFLVGRAPTHKYGLNIRPNGPPNIWVLAHTVNTPKKGHFWGYPKIIDFGVFPWISWILRDFRDFVKKRCFWDFPENPEKTGKLRKNTMDDLGHIWSKIGRTAKFRPKISQNSQKWPKTGHYRGFFTFFGVFGQFGYPQNDRFLTPFFRYRPVPQI